MKIQPRYRMPPKVKASIRRDLQSLVPPEILEKLTRVAKILDEEIGLEVKGNGKMWYRCRRCGAEARKSSWDSTRWITIPKRGTYHKCYLESLAPEWARADRVVFSGAVTGRQTLIQVPIAAIGHVIRNFARSGKNVRGYYQRHPHYIDPQEMERLLEDLARLGEKLINHVFTGFYVEITGLSARIVPPKAERDEKGKT